MATLKKIEDRTNWFIKAYNKLEKERRLPSNVELATIMGMPSKSTVSNILKRQQNIQPEQWQKFKEHFEIEELLPNSESSEREPTMKELLAGLTDGFRAIAETMRSMESKMALETTQGQMKTSLTEIRRDVTTLVERQESAVEEIRDLFLQLGAQKRTASKGVRKKADQNDGNG